MALDGLSRVYSLVRPMFNVKRIFETGQAGDGRERALLEHVLTTSEKGNPQSVIDAMDNYAQRTWFMNIGNDKGPILDSAVQRFDPAAVLELGTYCGYSAVRIASRLRRPGSKLITVEMSPDNSEIARQIIEHAGLSSRVQLVQGKFEDCIEEVGQFLHNMGASYFDFVFLDHWKHCYLPDFLLLKKNGMVGKGSCIFSDNMGPLNGPADFKDYLKTHTEEMDTVEHKSSFEYLHWIPDTVTISIFKLDLEKPSSL